MRSPNRGAVEAARRHVFRVHRMATGTAVHGDALLGSVAEGNDVYSTRA